MIIGLTGTLCSGKGVVSEYLQQKGFVYHSTSDVLRDYLRGKGIGITRENLQRVANELRQREGVGVLAKWVINDIETKGEEKAIADSIRNPGEIEELKKKDKFALVVVDAPIRLRFERCAAREREKDPTKFEAFKAVDRFELGEGGENSQQLGKCIDMADYVLLNDGTVEELHLKIDQMLEELGL